MWIKVLCKVDEEEKETKRNLATLLFIYMYIPTL